MTYKTLYVPLQFENTARLVLETGLALAGRLHGHVAVKHIRQLHEYYPPVDYYGTAVAMPVTVNAQQTEAEELFETALRTLFDEICDSAGAHIVRLSEASSKSGLTASWTSELGYWPEDIVWSARTADLSIAALPGKTTSRLETSLVEGLLMGSGRPVLMVPPTGMTELPERVLIAWDGSIQASRALLMALPLLEAAEQVVVATVEHEDFRAPSAEEATQYLERHQIPAVAKRLKKGKVSVSKCLLDEAGRQGSDLIVMGGYSHARLQERLIGGVTRHLLTNSDRPLLLAH